MQRTHAVTFVAPSRVVAIAVASLGVVVAVVIAAAAAAEWRSSWNASSFSNWTHLRSCGRVVKLVIRAATGGICGESLIVVAPKTDFTIVMRWIRPTHVRPFPST